MCDCLTQCLDCPPGNQRSLPDFLYSSLSVRTVRLVLHLALQVLTSFVRPFRYPENETFCHWVRLFKSPDSLLGYQDILSGGPNCLPERLESLSSHLELFDEMIRHYAKIFILSAGWIDYPSRCLKRV